MAQNAAERDADQSAALIGLRALTIRPPLPITHALWSAPVPAQGELSRFQPNAGFGEGRHAAVTEVVTVTA